MALLTQAPRGTQDVLPSASGRWRYLEKTLLETAALYGFEEIRVPTFEHTELFSRSVGDTTDVVQKEMYTFRDKGDRSITLRPEGTAGVLRAAIQNNLLAGALPVKLDYLISAFRYEKPQAGRLREFHQFGVELLGTASADADAEVIAMALAMLLRLGVRPDRLELNSIGCRSCRATYHKALTAYFSGHADELCDTCRERLGRNPMRILDCKSPICQAIAKDAPAPLDYLCDECAGHFTALRAALDSLQIPYTLNPRLVRGLDYYTRTVFEFISEQIGAQSTICGGGRYENLIGELGGQEMPGIGFAMGLERVLMVMEAAGCAFPDSRACDIYLGSLGASARDAARRLAEAARAEGFRAETDITGRSAKAQMKHADRLGARFSAIIGDTELAEGQVDIRDMSDGSLTRCDLAILSDAPGGLLRFLYDRQLADLAGQVEKSL